MKRFVSVLATLFACYALGLAQEAAKAQDGKAPSVSAVLDKELSNLEQEFVSLAEAMPEGKFEFVPTQGEFKNVRSFGKQVRHVAAVNFIVAGGLLGEKPPFDAKLEDGPPEIKTRAETLKFLKDSFAKAHQALTTVNEKNLTDMVTNPFNPQGKIPRLGLATIFTWHGFDHYGQMAVYVRMNGIVPPASRPK
jgi:uncharacterized damage-inducible protein DinB